MKKVLAKMAASAMAATMTLGSFTVIGSNSNAIMPNPIFQDVVKAEETSQSLKWDFKDSDYKEENDEITCNSIGKGDAFLISETKGTDFVYEADVHFNQRKGAASLVMRSNGATDGDKKLMYVANINGENGSVRLFKFEGNEAPDLFQQQKIDLTDDNNYHLKVVAIGAHMVYYINGKMIMNTADYTMGDDANDNAAAILGGQNDVITDGKFGLLTWEGDVTYKNITMSSITKDNTPQLSGLKAEANGGKVDKKIVFDEDQYVYITYVTNSTKSVKLEPTKKNDATVITATDEDGKAADINNLPVTKEKQTYTLKAKNGDAEVLYRVRIHKMQPDAEYYNEDYRGQYHYSVKDGWGNDPNGTIYFNGEYHLFYQYYDKAVWGPMHWIHATSKDLIHWEEDTIQFYPDEYGTMYSGCAVIADHDTCPEIFKEGEEGIVFLITADGGSEGQKIIGAYSKDGKTFHKYKEGKSLLHWREDSLHNAAFRDPKVFRYENQWFMVIAGGPLRIYSSENLIDWKEESVYGDLHTECPELYPLAVTDEDGKKTGEHKWVLNRGGRKYKIGDFKKVDGKWTFVPDEQYKSTNANGMGNEDNDGIMNFGPDSYAAMTYYVEDFGTEENVKLPDLIEINWMNTWENNFCKTIPYKNGNDVFNGTYNLQLKLGVKKDSDGKYYLTQTPISQYKDLRDTDNKTEFKGKVTEDNNPLKDFDGDSYEIVANITPGKDATEVGFKVRTGEGEETVVKYNLESEQLTLDRSKSGTLIVNGDINVRGQKVTKNKDGSIDFHIYVDRSSVEVFSKDDTVAGAMQIFPSIASRGLEVYSKGGDSEADITVYPMNTIWKDKEPAPSGIRLNKSSYEGYVGDEFNLNATVLPIGTEGDVVYKVEGDAVELKQDGSKAAVKAVKAGKAAVTVSLKEHPEIKKTCDIIIRENNFKTNLTEFNATAGKWYIDDETYYGSHNDNGFLFADKVNTDKFTYEVDVKYNNSGILNFIFQSQKQNAFDGCYAVQINGSKVRLFDFKGDKTFAETDKLEIAQDGKYHVEIKVDGYHIIVTINGKQYIDTAITDKDHQYNEGYVGLGLFNTSAEYQNFYINTDSPITKIVTKIDDLKPAINSSLEDMKKALPEKVIVSGDDFVKKDPEEITWDWSKVDADKPGTYEVVGSIAGTDVTKTVKVTVRSNKELAALAAKEYNSEDYTAESYRAYETALENAEKMLENADASQSDIDEAKNALQKAIDNLKKGESTASIISVKNNGTVSKDFVYGDKMGVTVEIKRADGKKMALYYRKSDGALTKLTESVTVKDGTPVTFSYDTTNKILPTGENLRIAVCSVDGDSVSVKDSTEISLAKKKLTASITGTLDKTYDGTTTAPKAAALSLDGVLNQEASASGTIEYGSPDAKNQTLSVKNFKVDYVSGADDYYITPEAPTKTGTIRKAAAPQTSQKYLTVSNNTKYNYSYDLNQLLPSLSGVQKWGGVSYELQKPIALGDYYKDGAEIKDGKLTLPIEDVSSTAETEIGTIKITVKSSNFEDFTAALKVKSSNRKIPAGTVTTEGTLTYGQALNNLKLTANMIDPDSKTAVAGTITWKDGSIVPNAGKYQAEWRFVPNDSAYAEITGTKEVQVDRKSVTVTFDMEGTTTKTYDGTVSLPKGAKINVKEIKGILDKDDVTVSNQFTAAYASADAGTKKIVVSGLTLTGSARQNYKLETPAALEVETGITKANPKKAKDITCGKLEAGKPLSSISLSGSFTGVNDEVLEGTLSWKDPDAAFNAGTHTAKWIFTPKSANYAPIEGSIEITVEKKDDSSNEPSTEKPSGGESSTEQSGTGKPGEKPATTEQKESDSKTSDENKQSSKSKASSVDKKKKNTVKAGDEADPARLILLLVLSLLSMGIFVFIIKRENAKK